MSTAFYETYRKLCEKVGKSDNAVAAEIGLSSATVTYWRQGALPRRPTIKKVADYFGVSVEKMMGYDQKEKPTPVSESGPSDDELIRMWQSLAPDEILRVKDFALGMIANRKEQPAQSD